jgi:mono/diheme cytochrome c family protein
MDDAPGFRDAESGQSEQRVKKLFPYILAPAFFAAAFGAANAQPSKADPVAAGRDIALKICANCHVVAEDQESAPLLKPPAPSFAEIAARPGTNEASLRDFLARPHGEARRSSRMPAFTLGEFQIAPLVAYIESLRPTPNPER